MTEPFITAEAVAAPLGVTPRVVRKWAAKGQIPGAHLLNGAWRFDPVKIRDWVEKRETWQKSTDAGKPTGAASSISAATYESRYTRLIGVKRKSDLPNGSAGSGP